MRTIWKKIDEVRGHSAVLGSVYVNRRNGGFRVTAEEGGHALFFKEGRSLPKLRELLSDFLDTVRGVELKPVIVISSCCEESNIVRFEYRRFFRGKGQHGFVWSEFKVEVPEGQEEDDVLEGKPGRRRSDPCWGGEEKVIPYTPEDWSTLRLVSRALQEVNAKLIRKTKNIGAFLEEIRARGVHKLLEETKGQG